MQGEPNLQYFDKTPYKRYVRHPDYRAGLIIRRFDEEGKPTATATLLYNPERWVPEEQILEVYSKKEADYVEQYNRAMFKGDPARGIVVMLVEYKDDTEQSELAEDLMSVQELAALFRETETKVFRRKLKAINNPVTANRLAVIAYDLGPRDEGEVAMREYEARIKEIDLRRSNIKSAFDLAADPDEE